MIHPAHSFSMYTWRNYAQTSYKWNKINDIKIPCLFWADDLVLISTTKDGLQNQVNVVNDYCSDQKLTLNAEKTKTAIFNKTGATLKKHQIHYSGELVKLLNISVIWELHGKFHTAVNEVSKKLQKLRGYNINCLPMV